MRGAIVCPPSGNFAAGLTSSTLRPDHVRALEQHQAYCLALEHCGVGLIRVEPDERYPDSTFVEDTSVLTPRAAIFSRPGADSRLGEVARIQKQLAPIYSQVYSIQAPGTLDGGDVCQAGSQFFIGISRRTNEAGAKQLAYLLASFGYFSTMVDVRDVESILHLKTGLTYLGDSRLVAIEALAGREEFRGYDIVSVNHDEAYAANCLRVNDRIFVAAGYPEFQAKLESLGYQTIVLEMSEFQKMDGGLTCLSLRF